MKLSEYAKKRGICYQTAYRWFHAGHLKGEQLPTGTILVDIESGNLEEVGTGNLRVKEVCIYARVSSSENKDNLEAQARRLSDYCTAKGWQVTEVVKEIGSGLNDSRAKLTRILKKKDIALIVVEHKDRLTRFGFNYIETLLNLQGRKIHVVNVTESSKEDLIQDFISVITSFCARIYGQRRSKRKTEKLIAEIKSEQ